MQRLIQVLWPSFIVAGIAEILFFTVIDPQELYFFGQPVHLSRLATYSIGFFAFWALCAASSMTTCFFQRTAAEINRCPLVPTERPDGCPKREEPGCCT
ncbi:MAG: hypothetical protein WCF44_17890 [Candidatus Methylophosphatis roskildensis]|jgi:hypothetical protein|uniref:Transmembrane protein n=1 Tax=Candidatus Methylophosphatis roskildensis TaxID=2899263 RepID=A0A9D7HT81_9PROT|nr:hypothetical protein [Candidatus Methylophosphatis roskildensis]MBK7235487.1 hypothetical protein [Sterolibacteriaceae bacterium]MBK7663390.1 hypothetical protein [Sterolibacteriaceae bacterium]MBK9083730.1 hypothetical protein [Sterolibacteriaceae bacterium]